MDSGERGMDPLAMTIINPRKVYWKSRRSTWDRTNDCLFTSLVRHRLKLEELDEINKHNLQNTVLMFLPEIKLYAFEREDRKKKTHCGYYCIFPVGLWSMNDSRSSTILPITRRQNFKLCQNWKYLQTTTCTLYQSIEFSYRVKKKQCGNRKKKRQPAFSPFLTLFLKYIFSKNC